jgi:hypothetical protein
MSDEKIFANGFSFKKRDNAPDFVVGRLSIKVDEAAAFLQEKQKNGWVNIDVKQAKSGTYYCELDTWEKSGESEEPKAQAKAPAKKEKTEDDLPF